MVAPLLFYPRGFVFLIGDTVACGDNVLGLKFDDFQIGAFVLFPIHQLPP